MLQSVGSQSWTQLSFTKQQWQSKSCQQSKQEHRANATVSKTELFYIDRYREREIEREQRQIQI